MAEDRMLSDEILLGLINSKSGGGGGGTSNYNALDNKPQIGGVTLTGNKSASDLGLVAAEEGKGLSSNDYTDADKAIVGGVTAALADKVDKINGKGLSTNDFTDAYKTAIGDNTTAIGAIKDGTDIDSFGDVETALAGKQATLTFDDAPTDGSNNPVKSNGIYDALALKQNATDNSLDTEAKTIVGAINEHEGDVDSLKSGLTNLDVALSVPEGSGKNLIPMTIDDIKALNTNGTWSGNAFTSYGVTYTVQTDSNGNVNRISANGKASSGIWASAISLPSVSVKSGESYILTGCPDGGGSGIYTLYTTSDDTSNIFDYGAGVQYTATFTGNAYVRIAIYSGVTVNDEVFAPMIRLASITDPTFAPYIPSVDARLEAVESGLDDVQSGLTNVNVALSVPEGSGKNLIPLSLANMKSANTTGTWTDNVYSISDGTITVNSDASGNITDLTVNGTFSARVDFIIATKEQYPVPLKGGSYIISGSTGGSTNTYAIWVQNHGSVESEMSMDGEGTFTFTAGTSSKVNLTIFSGVQFSNKAFYPMLRYATITDPTFAPYIPSVDARLEAVESGEYKVIASVAADGVKTYAELFIGLYNFVDGNKCYLSVGNIYYNFVQKSTYHAFFSTSAYFNGVTSLYNVDIQANAANYVKTDIASNGTVTVTDESSDVPTNGTVIKLVR